MIYAAKKNELPQCLNPDTKFLASLTSSIWLNKVHCFSISSLFQENARQLGVCKQYFRHNKSELVLFLEIFVPPYTTSNLKHVSGIFSIMIF